MTIDKNKSIEFIENTKDINKKLLFVDDPIRSIEWVKDYLKGLSTSDFVFLIGAEKLIDYKKASSIFENNFFDSTNAVHWLENENWAGLIEQLDFIYEENQTKIKGLITNIYADVMCREIIIKKLEQSNNMSITSSGYVDQDDGFQLLQKELFNTISSVSLDDAIKELEKTRNKIGEKTYYYFLAMAHYKAGNISDSIEVLESQNEELTNEIKLMLANMCILISKKNRAEEILNELYNNDKYLKDLFPTILRLYESDKIKYDDWLRIALRYDPNNPAIIEINASKMSRKEDFLNASNEFRRLGLIQNQEYYELVARMNDILGGKINDNQNIINYILEHTTKFPYLKNEGNLRLANYFIDIKGSYFLAYNCLANLDLNIGQPKVIEIAKLKLTIMKDELTASKAMGKLKPFKEQYDAKKIAQERLNTIIESIKILATEKNGYLLWRDFLECQSNDTWNSYAYLSLKKNLKKISKNEVNIKLSKSFLHNVISKEIQALGEDILKNPFQTSINIIKLLRSVKSGEFDMFYNFNTFEEFVKAILTPGEVLNDNRLRIICRYYLSIIAAGLGQHQDANNYALSTMELYELVDDEHKKLSLYLGLLSWGYSQYRLGRHTEGILCIIASIECWADIDEILPFLEEGINIVSRFIADDVAVNISYDWDIWEEISANLGDFNLNLKHFISMENKEYIKKTASELYLKIENAEIQDVNWAGDVVNLVTMYAKEKNMNKAIEILDRYGKVAILFLKKRKDIRFEILYNWSFIYFSNPRGVNNFFLALELIELANKDLENKRNVSHREERASIGAQSAKIYRLYIDICSTLLHLMNDSAGLKSIMENKIQEIIPKLSPRSIVEQKNHYNKRQYTQETIEVEKEFNNKREEYRNLLLQDGGNIQRLSEKAKIIEGLLSKLKEIHPNYMELKEYKNLTFLEIQQIIEDNEVLFQCILTTTGMLTILISKNDIKLEHKYLDPFKSDIRSLTETFSKHMQLSNLKYDELEKIIYSVSQEVGEELLTFLENNYIERIFFVPDFELHMFPLSVCRTEKISILDKTESIVNLIDYSSLLHFKRSNGINGVANRIIGNSSDPELKKIQKWLKENKKDIFVVLDNDSDNLDNLKNVTKNAEQINTVAIYAHGVSDPTAHLLDGAKGIEGRKKIFELEDVIDNISIMENFILISCSAGSPNYKMIEESYGTWATMFEKFNGNIISCRWDVSTETTLKLMKEVYNQAIENRKTIDKSLLIAQKKMKKMNYKDPQFWAGVEFWIN